MRRQKKTKISPKWIYDIEEEYMPSNDIFCEDDILYSNIKKIIQSDLSEPERRIILVYAEIGNIRDTAKIFKVSPSTIWNKIKDIKLKITNKL